MQLLLYFYAWTEAVAGLKDVVITSRQSTAARTNAEKPTTLDCSFG